MPTQPAGFSTTQELKLEHVNVIYSLEIEPIVSW